MGCSANAPARTPVGKKTRHSRFRVQPKGRSHPAGPPPTEFSIQSAGGDGILQLVPAGSLSTRQIGNSGKTKTLPDRWLTRDRVRVRIDGRPVVWHQMAEKYEHRLPYAVALAHGSSNGHVPIRLEPGQLVAIFLNVPGGGPQWTLALVGIE